jgi:cytosine/creatinine deaminase
MGDTHENATGPAATGVRSGSMSRFLHDALLPDGRRVDLMIADDGRIESVAPTAPFPGPVDGVVVDELSGRLLLAAMAEPHAHLDKALTAEAVPNPKGDLMGAIEAWVAAAATGMFTHDDTVERAAQAMELLLVHGVTAVRTHVNVLDAIGGSSVVAVKEAAARFDGLLDVQVVALTGSPMTGTDGAANRRALEAAIEAGVDLVGGCPHLDPDPAGLIANAIAVATDAGIGIDLHVDEMLDPSVLTLREFARQVIDAGFTGQLAASHCVTLGMQPPEVQAAVAREVAEAGIAVFPLPQTNLFLQGRDDPTATPRGLTAVQALRDAGVLVAAGADNVQDPFNLVGRSDPLETAALMVMAGHQLPDVAYEMVSGNVRRAMGLPAVTFAVGEVFDAVAIEAPSVRGAIADAPMNRRVYRQGRLVAESTQSTIVHR